MNASEMGHLYNLFALHNDFSIHESTSHMLKNIKTKRTSKLIPILHATSRCLLLSGTPALARPTELWPQLKILSTERDGWWDNEDEFVRKYVQRTSAIRRAELHTMLTGTLMIRRMKHDILKSLPSKQREKAIVDVLTPDMRREFHNCMKLLREGKGVMAKIAKRHSVSPEKNDDEKEINPREEKNTKLESLKAEYNERCRQTLQNIRLAMQSIAMNDAEKENLVATYFKEAKTKIDVWYKGRVDELKESPSYKPKEEELDRKTILNKMYSMTAKAKIPLIAELVGKWLEDPTKGKLCIFAHHIYVLDEIVKLVGLSNKQGSRKRFIRIDGSTSPKERQAQIVAFQTDPDIRIAVLGITAAGVAVTLTASSTVWFAELFWTPALMIQAEGKQIFSQRSGATVTFGDQNRLIRFFL
jgi:SNF2 family DNA or RNA helicase